MGVAGEQKISRFADLFCGVGGFHLAAAGLGLECVFASDIDADARAVYGANFGMTPAGDITRIDAADIPAHDLLCAGFPCQPFSIIGRRRGFDDERGQMFFEILRVLEHRRPRAVLLENVKQLATAGGGAVINAIAARLEDLGYAARWRTLDARDYGLPQKRERVIIVAALGGLDGFEWPAPIPMRSLESVLEDEPAARHFASERIRAARRAAHTAKSSPAIWHENKGGNVSSHQWSCALRAGASYNYLLVDGERRLTPRELFRLQGFPDGFRLSASDAQARKQAGNAVPIPMVAAALKALIAAVDAKIPERVG